MPNTSARPTPAAAGRAAPRARAGAASLPRSDVFNADCPCRPILDRVADKWTALVMGALEPGTRRFQELRREVGGVSQKMLTQTLRGLERDGLVSRRVYATVLPRVEYALTPLGRDLIELPGALRRRSRGAGTLRRRLSGMATGRETEAPRPSTARVGRALGAGPVHTVWSDAVRSDLRRAVPASWNSSPTRTSVA